MTPGISFLTTSPGVTSTKSTARGSCLVPRATASSCDPLRLCGTSAPRRLAKNVESARQRYVPLFTCPRLALNLPCFAIRLSKCTGTRPSCARCASRDYVCEYASEATSDSAASNTASTTVKSRRPSRRETREESAILTHHHKGSSPPSPGQPGPNHCTVIKAEIPEFLSLHHYPDHTSSYWEGSTPSDDCSMEEPWQFHHPEGLLPDATNHQNALAGQRPLSIAAPHPVRGVPHRSHPVPPALGVAVPVPLPAHTGDSQATAASHAEIQLPMLPHFDVPSQRLAGYEVYVQPEVKYEQCTTFSPSPHPYDS